jgi:hypothetical protein
MSLQLERVSGLTVNQVVIGSSANGLRDFGLSPDCKGNAVLLKFLLMSILLQVLKFNGNGSFGPLAAGASSSIWLYGMHRHGTSSCHEHHQP